MSGVEQRAEYTFSPDAWQKHSIDDDCPFTPNEGPYRLGLLLTDKPAAKIAAKALQEFLNQRDISPIRTYRTGTTLSTEQLPVGSVVRVGEEDYFPHLNYHSTITRWGIVAVHHQYEKQGTADILTFPIWEENGKRSVSPSAVSSVDKWDNPAPLISIIDLPLEIGKVTHVREDYSPQPDSPSPLLRMKSVLEPEAKVTDTFSRVTHVELWSVGKTDQKRERRFWEIPIFQRGVPQVG